MRQFISFQHDAEQSDATGTHRWMVSYADFITLLFILFVVLYAKMPKQPAPNSPKAQSQQVKTIPAIRPPPLQAQAQVETKIEKQTAKQIQEKQTQDKQQALLQKLTHTLSDLVATGDITFVVRAEGVLLEIRDTALFASGTAQPAEQAGGILAKISEVLAKDGNAVIVEGHTDSVPIQTAQYPSNWELSSARAASVVRALQEQGISPNRLTASGLAETKPKELNDTAQGRSANRRVSLLVLNMPASDESSTQPAQVHS